MVAIEGSSGDIKIDSYKDLNASMRAALAEHMIKEGFFSGADSFALKTDSNLVYFGAESSDLYKKNVEVYKKVFKNREQFSCFYKLSCQPALASSQTKWLTALKKILSAALLTTEPEDLTFPVTLLSLLSSQRAGYFH